MTLVGDDKFLEKMNMALVKQILETALYVKNIKESERFYKNLFELETYAIDENRHVFFKIGKSMLLLFNAEACLKGDGFPAHGCQGPGHMAFAVEHSELNFWRKRLKDQNIKIEKEITWPSGGKSIYFRDPDGHSLELATPDTWP